MRSPYNFIVTPLKNKRYDNIKDIGDVEFITSVSKEDHKTSNRFAKVVALPIHYNGPIKEGDTLLVHHNVFKLYYDMQGVEKSGRSFLKDNLIKQILKIPGLDNLLKKIGLNTLSDAPKLAGKFGAKALPWIGGLFNLIFAYDRFTNNDLFGGIL